AGDVVDEVDDRTPARRRWRPRSRHHGACGQAPDRATDDQSRQSRRGVRSRLCAAQSAADEDPLRALELVRVWRDERYSVTQTFRRVSMEPATFRSRDLKMKIAVCIKQVVTREWQLRVNDQKTWIRDQDASFELNEPDAYALEEALRLKEKHGGEVI